ncbi:MarR family transcriptional regulator [Actinomadura sp. NPDC048394]|jgi:DNA-binding MarR family transcriptional regulator|uniref:MarR family winged helix-turn-helix transcriptional regulator n=1 Tax=Actinomadura sp. NPDC048394 TaxID=3158223 RepID=UPI00340E9560
MSPRAVGRPDAVDMIIDQWHRERPDVDVSALSVFGRLHRGYQRYTMLLNEVFERHGITMAAFDVLATLRRSGPPYRRSAGELAGISLVSTGGVTLRLDRLEKAGLITRERDPEDRRVVYARLTPLGMDVTDQVVEEHFANERRMLSGLTETERKQLARLLGRLERSLEAAETAPATDAV